MFPNLMAEMARQGVTKAQIAKHLHRSPATVTAKFRGISQFTVDEAISIRRLLGVEMPISELFAKRKNDG